MSGKEVKKQKSGGSLSSPSPSRTTKRSFSFFGKKKDNSSTLPPSDVIKVLIAYYAPNTSSGIHAIAKAISEGVQSVGGNIEVSLKLVGGTEGQTVGDASELANYDIVFVGATTFFGSVAEPIIKFLQSSESVWTNGSLSGKVGSGFAFGSQGQETAVNSIQSNLIQLGFVVVGLPYSTQSQIGFEANSKDEKPSESQLKKAKQLGEHVSRIGSDLWKGRNPTPVSSTAEAKKELSESSPVVERKSVEKERKSAEVEKKSPKEIKEEKKSKKEKKDKKDKKEDKKEEKKQEPKKEEKKEEKRDSNGLTDRQRQIIKDTWAKVAPIREKAAKLFYERVFEVAPSVKPLFAQTNMKKQGLMLMDVLQKAVDAVDDLSVIIEALQELAVRHVEYKVEEAHYPVVGACLLWTLEQGLGKAWNDEVKEAWSTVYGVIAKVMIDAHKKAVAEASNKKSEKKSEKKGLTDRQRQIIKETWSKVVPIREKAAKLFYDRVFEVAPSVKPLFAQTNMKKQGQMLMDVLQKAVDAVDDLSVIIETLQELAVRHIEYKVEEAHYPVVGACLLWTLEQGLGKAWNDEVKEAWAATYGIIADVMIDAHKKAVAEAAKKKEKKSEKKGLTDRQRQIIKETWSKVVPIREKAAKLFYDRVFEVAPAAKPLFANTNMKKQGLMLMDVLQKAVDAVDDLSVIIEALQELAVRHVEYKVEEAHYPIVGACLLWTLEQGLGKAWNDEVKEAWAATYGIIADVMIDAHRKFLAEKKEKKEEKKGLTDKQKKILKETWAKVVPIREKAAKLFYDHLFEVAPPVKPLFAETNMKKQGLMLMDMLQKAVDGLDDLSLLVEGLQDLAFRHVEYGTEEAHYPVVGACLLWTLEQGLGKAWNDEVKEAWSTVYGIIADIMIDTHRKTIAEKKGQKPKTAEKPKINPSEIRFTEREAKIIKESWTKVTPVEEEAGLKFYNHLFKVHPEVKPLFEESRMKKQALMLMDILNKSVKSVDNITPGLIRTLKDTGKRHVQYNTEDAHYGPVGENLLWFIQDGLSKEDWTDELKAAWVKCYDFIAGVMIQGAHE